MRLKETAAALAGEFGADRVAALPCDVTDEDQVQTLFDTAVRLHGRLDIVVNNAGLGGTSALVDMTDEQWSRVLDVTLNGTFRCTRAALRRLRDQGGGGAVVNNASVVGWRAQSGQAHYAAAKAASWRSPGARRSKPPRTGSGSTRSRRASPCTPTS